MAKDQEPYAIYLEDIGASVAFVLNSIDEETGQMDLTYTVLNDYKGPTEKLETSLGLAVNDILRQHIETL